MPSWLAVVFAVMAVPLTAILGGLAIAGLGIWVGHKNRMAKLELQEKERQAEMDRELLGLGGGAGVSAHLEALLERMKTVEGRLDKMEAMANIEAARGRGAAPVSVDPSAARTDQRPRQEGVQ